MDDPEVLKGLILPSQLAFVSSMAIFQADRIAVLGPVVWHSINLGFRRDVLVGILKADGANQKARQSNSGGLVVARLLVYLCVYGGPEHISS